MYFAKIFYQCLEIGFKIESLSKMMLILYLLFITYYQDDIGVTMNQGLD